MNNLRFYLLAIALLFTSCLEDEDLVVMELSRIELEVSPGNTNRADIMVHEPAQLKIKGYNQSKMDIAINPSDFDLFDGMDNKLDGSQITHAQAGEYQAYAVHKQRKNLRTTVVAYQVYDTLEVVHRIDLRIVGARDSFMVKETVKFDIKAFDRAGGAVDITASEFELYDGADKKLGVAQLQHTQGGAYQVYAMHKTNKNLRSNTVGYKVHDWVHLVHRVDLNIVGARDSFMTKETVKFGVKSFDKAGSAVDIPVEEFDFFDGADKKLEASQLLHNLPGEFRAYAVHKSRKTLRSNTVSYKVHNLLDLIHRIDFNIIGARDSFLTKESIKFDVKSYARSGVRLDIGESQYAFSNQQGKTVQLIDFLNLKTAGTFELKAKAGNATSNILKFKVHDRNLIVDEVRLTADYYFVVLGSKANVQLKALPYAKGKLIDQVDISYTASGQPIPDKFAPKAAGTFTLQARVGNTSSNQVEIVARNDKKYKVVELPVVFHIIHDGEAVGTGRNKSYTDIKKAFDELNKSFRQSATQSSNPISIDTYIQFKLATKDPSGKTLAEPGVTRGKRPSTSHDIYFRDWMYDVFWDPDFYINIWVGHTGGNVSAATLPYTLCSNRLAGSPCVQTPKNNPQLQGIALNSAHLGMPYVLAHEMGHMLALQHVFNVSNCNADPDYCDDTFYYNRNAYVGSGAGLNRLSCQGILFKSDNYMDYQPGDSYIFTWEQRERMHFTVQHGLWRGQKGGQYLENGRFETPRKMSLDKADPNLPPVIVE